ncbi:hypothetical protein BDA99DRAFT_538843 [Phascolomyces articulosus]|uniref:FAR1 domain-containing protein n=1 Tax=Phascolomyces articulosus TaxID=60185 RepID=A0AAD5PCG9_9FUNG|nr:hypothetical protein BDA99DRAFT_538843 [Phascolomyces articulosus]
MTNPEHNHDQQQQKPFARVSMEPLFERLLKRTFPESVSAIEYCRALCAEFGFTVKQEASANRNIYVYCSREGLPDSQRNPKPSPQRKRPSKRCDCRWRVVLSENEHDQWEFRKSMNPNASEHNHEMMSPDEMVKAWPPEVNELIIRLARQRLQTHEIRETVKQQFPDITWNERRFYNRLTEERKRIKQRGVLDRSQRLLLLSARLCSIVASNEDWASSVEQEMARLLESYCQLSRLPPEAIRSLADLQPEMIQAEGPAPGTSNAQRQQQQQQQQEENNNNSASPASSADMMITDEASPAKKRKSVSTSSTTTSTASNPSRPPDAPKGTQVVYVPSYMLFVRNQPMRSSSEPSSHQGMGTPGTTTRRTFLGSPPDMHHPMGNMFPLASPTSSSSSSTSSLPFQPQQAGQGQQRQQQYGNTRRFDQRVSSPGMVHDQQSIMAYSSTQPTTAPPLPAPQAQPQQQYAVAQNLSSYPMAAAAAAAVAGGGPFSPYNMGPQSTTDIQFGFDGGMATAAATSNTAFTTTTPTPQQQQPSSQQQQRLERPEPTHPHDAAYQQQQRASNNNNNNNNNNNSSSWSPSVFNNSTYPIKEEPIPDQRTMLLREQQQQRLSRNISQQGFIPSSMSMMRSDDQQVSSSNDNTSTPTWS